MVVDQLDAVGWTVAVIPPTSLKKYATGKGTASKDLVLTAAVRRFPDWPVEGNDEADALWAAAAGLDHLGYPVIDMPALNRSALDGMQWPDAMGEAA